MGSGKIADPFVGEDLWEDLVVPHVQVRTDDREASEAGQACSLEVVLAVLQCLFFDENLSECIT